MRTRIGFLVIALFVSLVPAAEAQSASVPTFDAANPRSSFAAMAEYLSTGSGQWRSPNPNHDATQARSAPAFGLWFAWDVERRTLELSIVVHYADSTVLSSKGQWVWHPTKHELKYQMIGRNGSLTEGVTELTEPSTFTTTATFHGPNGRTVNDSVHRNETFVQGEDGSWQSQGVYQWTRSPG